MQRGWSHDRRAGREQQASAARNEVKQKAGLEKLWQWLKTGHIYTGFFQMAADHCCLWSCAHIVLWGRAWSQVRSTLPWRRKSKQDGGMMIHSSTAGGLIGTQNFLHKQEYKRYKRGPSEAEKRSLCVWGNWVPAARGNQRILIFRGDNSGAVLVFPLSWKALDHQTEVLACRSVL